MTGILSVIKSYLKLPNRKLLVSLASLSVAVISPVSAQAEGEGVLGWRWDGVYYPSAEEACRAQWEWAGMNNGYSRFIGAFPYGNSWTSQECSWTSFQYLCRQETGGGLLNCWTVLPAAVSFSCESGYTRTAIGRCVKPEDLRPERPPVCYNNGGNSNDTTNNPVILGTGAKVMSALDYESADGRFRIGRNYRSIPVGATTSYRDYPLGLARGWQFDFAMEAQLGTFSGSLASSPTGNVTIVAPDGSGYDFILNTSGDFEPRTASGAVSHDYQLEFVGPLPTALTDIYDSSTQWIVTGPDDRKWTLETFSKVNAASQGYRIGRPTEIARRDGYEWTLTYNADGSLDKIEDTFGRTASFTWYDFYITFVTGVANTDPVPEAVRSITFPDGSSVEYQYDPAPVVTPPSTGRIERLTGASILDGNSTEVDSTTYLYENSDYTFAVTGVVDHRNVRIATYEYDDLGRAILTQGADGENEYTIEYGASGSLITRRVTNPLGRETVYSFERVGSSASDIRLVTIDGEATPNCPASEAEVAYGVDGFVDETVDEEGRITQYTRDDRGRPTTIVEGVGTPEERETTITWHTTWNVPITIVQPGLTTTRTYNGSGQLVTLTETDTTTHTVPYSTNGQTRTWTYTYTTGGLVASVDGPLPGSGDTMSYTYDADGYLATYTNEVGHVTTVLSINDRGNPTSIENANGIAIDLQYDALGRVTEIAADPAGIEAVTLVEYDLAGNISKITDPDGSFLGVEYDGNNRVEKITDNFDETIVYAYDAMGNNTLQEFKEASTSLIFRRQNTFDELGRLMEVIGVGPAVWAYGYDKVNNLTSVSDPNTNAVGIAYDSLNRIVSFTDERDDETTWAYGATDDAIATTDPHDVTTSYVRNGWGEAIQEQSNDIGATVLYRNEKGQVTERTDARSVVTEYDYDAAGRLLEVSYPGQSALNIEYTYDSTAGGNSGIGRLTGVTDAVGTISYIYDALGHVIKQEKVVGVQNYAFEFEWNDASDLVELVYPSGRIVTFGRDANGSIESVHTQASSSESSEGLAWWISYTPFGPRQGLLHGNELTDWRIFDLDGRITSWIVADEAAPLEYISHSFGYVDDRNLTSITDNLDPLKSQSFWYTENGFLQNASGSWGDLTFYVDGTGNITHRILYDGATTTAQNFGIPVDSNRLAQETTDSVLTREFTSDAAGNIIAENNIPASTTKAFTYNHAGQLAGVDVNSTTEGTYGYDYLSRLTTRTLAGSSTTLHFVHDLDGNIIAEYDAAGAVLREYIWLEERPLAVVDHSGTSPAIYHVHADHLGRPVMLTDDAKAKVWEATYLPFGGVHSLTGPASLDYRFPGQWFQLESGLHYNWHRHYDPATGRYLQPDPLGMPDGPSRWVYALNSPLMNTDREGLSPFSFLGPALRILGPRILPPLLWGPLEPAPFPSGPLTPPAPNEPPAYCPVPPGALNPPFPPNILNTEGNSDGDPQPETTPRPDVPTQGGGRSGGRVKDLKGPPNSAIKGTGGRIFVTDKNGNVVADITPDRAKDVTPGVGFGPKRPATPQELELWKKLNQ
ncbi:RHS repeat-associated core domain-containing protein [Mesorhizobium sp. CAU 1732]|uniref:RHS repeat-associated core domain-containing protein n=1 Tax=Mesorhizobium sp. CAU 1732 TaxID=3140358 RepID=UPI003260FE45